MTTRTYRVTGRPGDETITIPDEIQVQPDGSAIACHADSGDVSYPTLEALLRAYTLGVDDIAEATRCQCGEWSGEPCSAGGDLVTIEWMPPQYRDTHTAAGNRGTYPGNGAVRWQVTRECADAILAGTGDDWAQEIA